MKKVFTALVWIFLYLPAFWFAINIARDRDFFSLSILEMAGGAFVLLMPLAIISFIGSLIDKKSS